MRGVVLFLFLWLGWVPGVLGHVWASGLQADRYRIRAGETVRVVFLLNEPADTGVGVDVVDAAGVVVHSASLGARTAGWHAFYWDGRDDAGEAVGAGAYRVRVTAADDGHWAEAQLYDGIDNDGDGLVDEGWALISQTNLPSAHFRLCRGLDINRNPESPFFGRVYVAESAGGTTIWGRTTTRGVYILNANLSAVSGQGAQGRTGGVDWPAGSNASPGKLRVGPDDRVYVADWSDGHSGVWVGDPDFIHAHPLLSNANRREHGLTVNHGSVSAIWVESAVAGDLDTGVVLYSVDEDWPTGVDGPANLHRGSILRYDVGHRYEYAELPAVVYDDSQAAGAVAPIGRIVNSNNQLERDAQGNWYLSQYRFGTGDAYPSLLKISPDGGTVLFDSVRDLRGDPASGFLHDPFGFTSDLLALDEARGRLVASGYYSVPGDSDTGYLTFIDPEEMSPATIEEVWWQHSPYLEVPLGDRTPSYKAGVFDPAGNLILANTDLGRAGDGSWLLGYDRLEVWSPPDGANQFTTQSWFTIRVTDRVGPEAPVMESVAAAAGGLRVTWVGGVGDDHTLEYSPDRGGAWAVVRRLPVAEARNSVVVPVPPGGGFLRVVAR